MIRFIDTTTEDSTSCITIGLLITYSFREENGVKQEDKMDSTLVDLSLELVIRQVLEDRNATIQKSVQIVRYTGDVNIMGKTKQASEEACEELNRKAIEMGLNIMANETKAMLQCGRHKK